MKYIKYIKYLFLLISVLTLVYFIISGVAGNTETGADVMLKWAYVSLALTVLATIIFPLINLFTNPKGAVRSLVGLVVVLIVIGVCYALSSAEPVVDSSGGFFENPVTLKLSDTGLYAAYIAMAATVLIAIVGEIINAFK